MSGSEARIWPVADGLWRGEITASEAGVRVDVSWHGRPFIQAELNHQTKKYTVKQVEKAALELEQAAVILREAGAAARRFGAK
jgi:hypothetical protein